MRYGGRTSRSGIRTIHNGKIQFNNMVWVCKSPDVIQINGKRVWVTMITNYSEWHLGCVSNHELLITGIALNTKVPSSCYDWVKQESSE